MNFNFLVFLLVSFLTIQVRGKSFQPNDLRGDATQLLEELKTRSQSEVNEAFLVLWPLDEILDQSSDMVVTEGPAIVQETIDGVFEKLHQFKNDTLDQGLDYSVCERVSEADMNDSFQKSIGRLGQCAWDGSNPGMDKINQGLAGLNNIFAEVSLLGINLDNCVNDRCIQSIIVQIQESLDTLSKRITENRDYTVEETTWYSSLIEYCIDNSILTITMYTDMIIANIEVCLKKQKQ